MHSMTYQYFVLRELGNLGLLAVRSLDTEQSSEKEVVDLELSVDVWQMSAETQDETDKTIGTTQCRVNAGSHTNQTTGYSEFEIVVLCEQRHYS